MMIMMMMNMAMMKVCDFVEARVWVQERSRGQGSPGVRSPTHGQVDLWDFDRSDDNVLG